MEKIYRYIVSKYGDEKAIFKHGLGRIAFINCIYIKQNIKIPLPKWRFDKIKYERELVNYGIKSIRFPDYSMLNSFIYRIFESVENHDCICLCMIAFAFDDLYKIKDFLLQLEKKLTNKTILLIIERNLFEEIDVFSEFPIYEERDSVSD